MRDVRGYLVRERVNRLEELKAVNSFARHAYYDPHTEHVTAATGTCRQLIKPDSDQLFHALAMYYRGKVCQYCCLLLGELDPLPRLRSGNRH